MSPGINTNCLNVVDIYLKLFLESDLGFRRYEADTISVHVTDLN